MNIPVKLLDLMKLMFKLVGLTEKLDENRDLRLQYLRHDRLDQVIYSANGIALECLGVVGDHACQENDRRMPRTLALFDERCNLAAAHSMHLYVKQDLR